MLLRNFKNMLVGGFGGSASEVVTLYDGTKVNATYSLGSLMQMFYVANVKFESLTNDRGTFIFGSSTDAVTEADYFLDNRLDNSADFTIISSSRITPSNQDAGAKIIITQIWSYTGDNDVTINQIAFMTQLNSRRMAVMKQKLQTPIVVHKDDTFTITCTIFGSLADQQ